VEVRISPELEAAAGLAVAALIGLAVGIEREWSGHASGPHARFAGARTFLALGLTGGAGGLLLDAGAPAVAAVILAGGAALAIAAYSVTARAGDPEAVDGTTEAAALAVLALAALAGTGRLRLAAASGAVLVLALREKSAIHAFVRRIGDIELRAALQFAVLSLVLLPILPVGPFGPLGGVRPRELWFMVLLVSGLNFAGYLARRAVGSAGGTAVAGMMGGLISSTAVTLSFSRQSREEGVAGSALALGTIGACTVLIPRLLVVTLALRPALTLALAPFLLPPLAVGAALLGLGLRRQRRETDARTPPEERNPLRLGLAILMAIGFQAVLLVMTLVRQHFGDAGVITSSAFLGLTDMDALTLAMTRMAGTMGVTGLAATGIAVGVLANTVVKLGLALALGTGEFRRRAGAGLGLLCLASLIGLWCGGGW
jgi:uncharacterized membrane protein (DUF4010 family)